ncbi:MAG: response regulator transcription factor [Lachnospiraceae bacterium]|nr:response regulator transcription factor [Lachnospiraceae bacterium]
MAYNVLVVDDQTMPRQLFENIINNSARYELAASVDSASVADVYCAGMRIDMILMDVVMSGGINGIEAAARIKASYPDIRILVVTSMPDGTFLDKARAAGVDSFWYKEVQDAPLLEIMDRTMAGEQVYPDHAPIAAVGLAKSTDFTGRELEVLRYVAAGYSDKEIAQLLVIGYGTVRVHLNNLLQKTGCNNRTELAILAAKTGIVVPEI